MTTLTKRIDDISHDEQELLKLSTKHSLEHQYAADFRIGFRYGFNRGKNAGFQAALNQPEVKALEEALEDNCSCDYNESVRPVKLVHQCNNCTVLKSWREFKNDASV